METKTKDYGCDPLPDGKWKMIPSGDIVDFNEMRKRLPLRERQAAGVFGHSWEEIAMMQGGRQTLDITRPKI